MKCKLNRLNPLIAMVILSSMFLSIYPGKLVDAAAGSSNITVTTDVYGKQARFDMPSNTNVWTTMTDTASPRKYNPGFGGNMGWYNSTLTVDRWNSYWGIVSFNVTGIPAASTVTDIKLRIYVNSKTDTYPSWQQFYAVYTGTPADPSNLTDTDGRKWWFGNPTERISNVVDYDDITAGAWNEFNIADVETGLFDYVTDDADGRVPFYLLTTNHAGKYPPPDSGRAGNQKNILFETYQVNPAQLVITYVADAAARTTTHDDNASVAISTDGSEYTANITWGTPKAAYKDDDGLWLKVNGAGGASGNGSGANVTLQLEDTGGVVLDTVSDSIRSDGNYDYWLAASTLETLASGFLRLHETNDNVYSDWGYLADSPSSTQRTNDIYSLSTVYGQWSEQFQDYVVGTDNLMFVHWKTNIDFSTENATQELEMRLNGVSGSENTAIYNETLGNLHTDYFECDAANAATMLHWRYAIFNMNPTGAGYNDYNGLVIDLETPLVAYNKGFIQPAFLNRSDNTTLTNTHTSYWYLASPSEYIGFSINKASYETNENINVTLRVPAETQATTYLRNAQVNIGGTYITGFQLNDGNNDFIIAAPSIEGGYYIQIELSDDDVDNYYYAKRIGFDVLGEGEQPPGEPPTAQGWLTWLNGVMQRNDLDNEFGRWIILLLAAIVAGIAFYKYPAILTGCIVLILAGGFAAGWINPWFVALCAPIVAIIVYGIFKKKTSGGGV